LRATQRQLRNMVAMAFLRRVMDGAPVPRCCAAVVVAQATVDDVLELERRCAHGAGHFAALLHRWLSSGVAPPGYGLYSLVVHAAHNCYPVLTASTTLHTASSLRDRHAALDAVPAAVYAAELGARCLDEPQLSRCERLLHSIVGPVLHNGAA
jgi:hypothetical protein